MKGGATVRYWRLLRWREIALVIVTLIMILLYISIEKISQTQVKGNTNQLSFMVGGQLSASASFRWLSDNNKRVPNVTESQLTNNSYQFQSLRAALEARASKDRDVMIALIDFGVIDMTLNFIETSLKNVDNYVFLSTSKKACDVFHNLKIPCYVYVEDTASESVSFYMTKDYIRKMNLRIPLILEVLNMGYNVLHSDTDVYFFDNPFPEVRAECDHAHCDIIIMWDNHAYNAGFMYIRSSENGKKIFQTMNKIVQDSPTTDDQTALNEAIEKLKNTTDTKTTIFNTTKFQIGYYYFELGRRTFAGENPCSTCLVVHNNWIAGLAAKHYRFRETHLWMYDGPEAYYSSTNRKYLIYDNPVNFFRESKNWLEEKHALQSALAIGHILNRTVILPEFHCDNNGKNRCSLLSHLNLAAFNSIFSGVYREHSFLSHSKVPKEVKESQSQVYLIGNGFAAAQVRKLTRIQPTVKTIYPKITHGASSEEIIKWFKDIPDSVLRFHSLYRAFSHFSNPRDDQIFHKRTTEGFVSGFYRQH